MSEMKDKQMAGKGPDFLPFLICHIQKIFREKIMWYLEPRLTH